MPITLYLTILASLTIQACTNPTTPEKRVDEQLTLSTTYSGFSEYYLTCNGEQFQAIHLHGTPKPTCKNLN